jgi:hypothetical protein
MGDQTYQELEEFLKGSARVFDKAPNALADTLRKNYGAIACDPDAMGNSFEIGKVPSCQFCGCQKIEYWEETELPEFVEENIKPVTHLNWNMLADAEKVAKVEQVLSRYC